MVLLMVSLISSSSYRIHISGYKYSMITGWFRTILVFLPTAVMVLSLMVTPPTLGKHFRIIVSTEIYLVINW